MVCNQSDIFYRIDDQINPNIQITNGNNNSHNVSMENRSNSQNNSVEDKEESADYEIDEKNDMIIDKRIKYFLIQLENWLFNEQ